jgi:hypothetical protein
MALLSDPVSLNGWLREARRAGLGGTGHVEERQALRAECGPSSAMGEEQASCLESKSRLWSGLGDLSEDGPVGVDEDMLAEGREGGPSQFA